MVKVPIADIGFCLLVCASCFPYLLLRYNIYNGHSGIRSAVQFEFSYVLPNYLLVGGGPGPPLLDPVS